MKLTPTFTPPDQHSERIVTKTSFNEGLPVEFDPVKHLYSYQGKILNGATGIIKKFYKPFENDIIAAMSAKAWGVETNEVKAIWDGNKNITADFGTVIHKTLEHYNNFRKVGEIIQKKKELEENYAIPKMPFLKEIVAGFLEVNKTSGEEILSEVLLTNVAEGFAGTADLLLIVNKEKKICRVQDYKINVDSEEINKYNKVLAPFDHLPANKLSKYQLQLSVYSNLLEKSGWTVEGLDVFVYEDCWKHYPLEVLKVI